MLRIDPVIRGTLTEPNLLILTHTAAENGKYDPINHLLPVFFTFFSFFPDNSVFLLINLLLKTFYILAFHLNPETNMILLLPRI